MPGWQGDIDTMLSFVPNHHFGWDWNFIDESMLDQHWNFDERRQYT